MKSIPTFGTVILGFALSCAGQPKGADSQANTAIQSKADQPMTAVPAKPLDADIERIMHLLTGSFVAAGEAGAGGKEGRPALRLNSAVVNVEGLDNAVYFEIAREDSSCNPFRAGIMHAFRRRGELRLRVFDFKGQEGLADAMTGLWAAPDVFPALTVAQLSPNMDIALEARKARGPEQFVGSTPNPYPTMRDGAVEMTGTIALGEEFISISDQGYDPAGKVVWGSDKPVRFARGASPVKVTRVEGGLVIITMVEPAEDEPILVEGGEVAVQYTGWLTNGFRFDSSRQEGRNPIRTRVPSRLIKGWNEGLTNVAKGERRRLVIPAEMAYGANGQPRAAIPPDSALIFDVECVWLDNSNPVLPPPQPPAPVNPHGGLPGGPQPGQPVQPATKPADPPQPH